MRRMLEAAGQKAPATKPVLELNVTHPLLQRLERPVKTPPSTIWRCCCSSRRRWPKAASSGPAAFVQRLNRLLITMP